MPLRRLRGFLLRLIRRRVVVVILGVLLAAPAGWIEIGGRYDQWWVDGLCLVFGATGVALVWAGLTGPRPDWIDES